MSARRMMDRSASAKLGKLIRLLGTDRQGERLAAVEALGRTLKSEGLDFNDFGDMVETLAAAPSIQPGPELDWRAMVRLCQERDRFLKPRERDFIANLARWRGELRPKQRAWLEDCYARIERAAA